MTLTSNNSVRRAPGEDVSETFIRYKTQQLDSVQQRALEARLASDADYAAVWRGLEKSWRSVGTHAESPELLKLRESAIAWARREHRKRWTDKPSRNRGYLAACATLLLIAVLAGLQISPYGYRPGLYRTGIDQQTRVDLADHSRVELDAATRLRVAFTETERTVQLLEGQAQFSVAKDPTRPFRVIAGHRTIEAIGTVFIVEYVNGTVHVATLEGKVSVSLAKTSRQTVQTPLALIAGEELRVQANGQSQFVPNADLAAATAWREGNVIFRDEPLGSAIARLNRYSRTPLVVEDPSIADIRISGVFQKGDSAAFARTVSEYYPVVVEDTHDEAIRLRAR